ncbi:MAG: hypothetical protein ACOZB0_12755 [Pseudomonadota bacterium]
MSKTLLITGGSLRANGYELGEGKYYECAKLLKLDLDSGRFEVLLAVDQGNENFPAEHPNLEFTVGTVEGDILWLPTDTEIRKYRYPSLVLEKTFSHPCFHNIHSVAQRGDKLYVTSTGLDMVVVLDKDTGRILEYINAEGKPTWHRFSEAIDYRQEYSTRPHDCHPNYVFWIGDEPWVTRCRQEDAVQISDMRTRIDISGSKRPMSVHDGIVVDDKILFTTVDGCVVVADPKTQAVLETFDLSTLKGFGGLRGWCRGLHIDGDILYVGFSKLRRTRQTDKLRWAKKLLAMGKRVEESSVLAIDFKLRRIVGDYRIPQPMIDAIYTLLPTPGSG